jgi:hypothetical protein
MKPTQIIRTVLIEKEKGLQEFVHLSFTATFQDGSTKTLMRKPSWVSKVMRHANEGEEILSESSTPLYGKDWGKLPPVCYIEEFYPE